jgi:hypothetical protein
MKKLKTIYTVIPLNGDCDISFHDVKSFENKVDALMYGTELGDKDYYVVENKIEYNQDTLIYSVDN